MRIQKSNIFVSGSAVLTKKFAADLAKKILQHSPLRKGAFVVGLEGELGAGKTTFAQGFARGLGIKEKILSPTFVILKKFKIPASQAVKQNPKFKNFYHGDAYRLQNPKEFLALGFKKIIASPQTIILIEWAERVKGILPSHTLWIHLAHAGTRARKIVIH